MYSLRNGEPQQLTKYLIIKVMRDTLITTDRSHLYIYWQNCSILFLEIGSQNGLHHQIHKLHINQESQRQTMFSYFEVLFSKQEGKNKRYISLLPIVTVHLIAFLDLF